MVVFKIATLAYFGIVSLFYFAQESFLFFPSDRILSECALVKQAEIDYQKTHHFIKYNHPSAKANLILFHGNGGGACDRAIYIEKLMDSPVNIILAEYPGYSGDKNEISQKLILKRAQDVFDFIKKDELPIILYGESLGSAVATYLAAKNKVTGLVLHNPYTSINDLGQGHYPLLPIALLNKNSFKAKEWAPNVEVSPLVIQGELDEVIPTANVDEQVKNFKHAPKYIKIPGVRHNDLVLDSQVFTAANDYIQKVLPNEDK